MDYNGIIVIRQVKTIGYDVDTGKLLSLIGLLYCSQKNQTWQQAMVIEHFDLSVEVFLFSLHSQYPKLMFHSATSMHFTHKMKRLFLIGINDYLQSCSQPTRYGYLSTELLGILVLGLHPTPDVECGLWTYKLPLRPTTPEAVYITQVTMRQQLSNRVGHEFGPGYRLGYTVVIRTHFIHFLFGTNFMLIIILVSF